MASTPLEFWVGYGSTYTYLSVMRIEAASARAGVELVWKPFNIRTLMIEKGLPTGPFMPRPEKLAYMWRLLSLQGGSTDRSPEIRDLASTMSKSEIAEAESAASKWRAVHRNVELEPNGEPGLTSSGIRLSLLEASQ